MSAYHYEKVDKRLLVPQIEDQIMLYIQQENIEIGGKLPNEFKLAEQFGVGRSTIREVIKSLATKGVLEVRRGAGTYVISNVRLLSDPLGLARFKNKYQLAMELFDVRIILEPEIAALACKNATKKEKQELQMLCNEVEQEYRDGKNHLQKDMEYHTCIAKCSKNHVVETLIPVIHTAITTFGNLTHRKLMEETIQSHRQITNAIINEDQIGAKCAMIMHLTYNRQKLQQMMLEQQKTKMSDVF